MPRTTGSPSGYHNPQQAFACSAKVFTNCSYPSSPRRASSPRGPYIDILFSGPVSR